jgi:pimeloyl-ACP methyl ester carboxylesterase
VSLGVKSFAMRSILQLALCALLAGGCMSFHSGPLPGEPKDAQFTEIGGARVRYIDVGKGSPVVLVHGFASSLDVWPGVVRELEKRHRLIALDLKGFGWSSRPEGDYSPTAQAQLVIGLLDRLGVKKAAFVGHSWGASVVLTLALRAPERVTRIALYDAWVYEEQLPTAFLFSRADGVGEVIFGLFYDQRPDDKMEIAFYDPDNLSQDLVDEVDEQLDRPGTTAAALAAVRGQRYEEIEKRYPEIKQPVLLLWGREDRVTTLEYGERLSKELPNAKLEVFPQCGHFPMIEAKNPSTRALAKFLSAAPKTAAPKPEPSPPEPKEEQKKAPEPPVEPAPEPEPEEDDSEEEDAE